MKAQLYAVRYEGAVGPAHYIMKGREALHNKTLHNRYGRSPYLKGNAKHFRSKGCAAPRTLHYVGP